jgi:hypothetical protein
MAKRISVVEENASGRNMIFKDNSTGKTMSRAKFVQKINDGDFPNFHVKKINNVLTPVSNPDKSKNNNLDKSDSYCPRN